MIYFSEIYRKNVVTEDGIYVGKLEDFIFLVTENPLVTKFVIRNKTGQKLIVPIDYLKKINSSFIIEKDFLTSYLEENELYLVKNLLDKQIIDLKGDKIVRVNDVVLQEKDKIYIAGVDIGILGMVRRIRLWTDYIYKFIRFFNIKLTSNFLSWADIQPLELIRGQVKLKKKEEKLERIRPEDLADYLERTNVLNARKFLRMLDTEKAAEVISNLNIKYQTALFKQFKPENAARLINYIDPDEAVDVLLTLPAKRREEIINFLKDNTKKKVLHLLNLSKTPIGQLITTEYLTIESNALVKDLINKIKKETVDYSTFDYVYVINKEEQLVGVLSLHDMLLQDFDMPIYKFMTQNVVIAHLTTPEEIVAKKMLKYRLYALPVIDDRKLILGIITLDDVSACLLKKFH